MHQKLDCKSSERNTLIIISNQKLAFGVRAKGACPTGTLDLARKQKEGVQLAPLCRQGSKRNVSTGTLVLAIAIWFLG